MKDTSIRKRENQDMGPERMEQTAYFTQLVDIIETDDEFVFHADLPGVKAGDVDIIYNNVLTIRGKVDPRQPAEQNYIWQEYGVGHFYRQFTLNTPINADAIKAGLKNGVLDLHVPKAESAKTLKIQIKSA